jgi:serine/threonine protein kinase/WD40 repeat protein
MSTCPECGLLIEGEADILCPKCLLSLGTTAFLSRGFIPDPNTQEHAGDHIGNYRLLKVIGEGAFGLVWEAIQEAPLRRVVALKIIKLGMDTRAVVARFEAERQVLALMEHQNIARVFDAGATGSGRPYFVMELVRGVPITDYCDEARLGIVARIHLMLAVCDAVQHAHHKGVIHRDLKPSNILVTTHNGSGVAKVIDFGIAKATQQRLTEMTLLTQNNQFFGTPAYMSPEQTGLGDQDVDTRADVYSLGVVLYELVTGCVPFAMCHLGLGGIEAARKAICETEPAKPSSRIQALAPPELMEIAVRRGQSKDALPKCVRGDLDWIILRTLEKERSRRYQSAGDLAADLQRFLKHEPVSAVQPALSYQLAKFVRRNRVVLATLTAFIGVLVLGSVVSTWQAIRATRLAVSEKYAKLEAQAANSRAQEHLVQARLNAYASEMNVAQQAFAENNLERTLQLLDRQRPQPGETFDLRGFEWRYLWQLCQSKHRTIFHDSAAGNFAMCSIALSPTGRWLAYHSTNGVMVRDLETHQVQARLPVSAQTIAWSADGRVLVTANLWNAPVRLWDSRSWKSIPRPELDNTLGPAVFSPDGRWLLTGSSRTNMHQLWNTDTWEVVSTCVASPMLAVSLRSGVTFSPDGRWLITPWMNISRKGGGSGMMLWKVPSLEKRAELFVPDIPLQGARFLPDGKRLVTSSWLGHLLVWDLEANPPQVIQEEREHTTYIPSLELSPSGRRFVTGSADQSVCVWDSQTCKLVARWRGHRREVWSVAMASDDETVASCGPDGTVRLWNGHPTHETESFEDAGDIAGFSADGGTLVLAPGVEDFRWQLVSEKKRIAFPIPEQPGLIFDFSRPHAAGGSQPLGAIGRSKGKLELWDLTTGSLTNEWNPGTHRITAVALSADGVSLVSGDTTGTVRLIDLSTGKVRWERNVMKGRVTALAFSPDGHWLATGNLDYPETRIWDVSALQEIVLIPVTANRLTFSPDG